MALGRIPEKGYSPKAGAPGEHWQKSWRVVGTQIGTDEAIGYCPVGAEGLRPGRGAQCGDGAGVKSGDRREHEADTRGEGEGSGTG